MSRAYRVSVSGSVERIVHVDDGVCSSLELLPILPRERMSEHLAEELVRRGFTRDGNVARRAMEDGITVEVELQTGTVTVRVESAVEIDVKGQRSGRIPGEAPKPTAVEATKKRLEAELQEELEKEVLRRTERGRREATAKLEGRLRDLKQELDGAVNRVTAQALKEKARQMGEIEEIIEDERSGGITIKVKL
jgi:hypothetical protein